MADLKSGDVLPEGTSFDAPTKSGHAFPEGTQFDPPPPPSGLVGGLAKSFVKGAGAEAAGPIGTTLGLAASVPFMAADKLRGMVSGKEETGAQDWAFSHLVDPAAQAAQSLAPTAEEQQSVPMGIARGLGGMAVDLPLIMATGAAGGAAAPTMVGRALQGMRAMAPVAVAHGINQTGTQLAAGVDAPTAYASGALSGLTTSAMGAIPMSLQGNLLTRAASGAASNIVTGEVERHAQNAVLSAYPKQQTEFNVRDAATSAATGALLGAVMGPRPDKAAVVDATKDTADALNKAPDSTKTAPEAQPAPEAPVVSPADALRAELAAKNFTEPDPAIAAKLAQTVPDGETAPAVLPKGVDESHDAAIARLNDAGMPSTGVPQQDRANAFALDNAPIAPDLAQPVPNVMTLAMQDAARVKAAADAKMAVPDAFSQSEQAAAAAKAQQLDAIQNIAKGDQLAGAAAQGEVLNPTLRKPVSDFTSVLQDVLPEAYPGAKDSAAKAMLTKVTKKLSDTLSGVETHDEQLAAIAKLRDAAPKGGVMESIYGTLYGKLNEGKVTLDEATPAIEAAKAIEAQPAPAEGSLPSIAGLETAKPVDAAPEVRALDATPVAAPAPEATPQTPRDAAMVKVQAARDTFAKVEADFDARLNAGEKLSPSEQQRYNESTAMSAALEKSVEARDNPAHLEALAGYAKESETPQAWAKADKSHLSSMSGGPRDLPLTQAILSSNKLTDTLAHIAENGSTPEYRELAAKLRGFDLPTTIDTGDLSAGYKLGAVGGYDANADHVRIPAGGESEAVVLHEALHAASFDALDQAGYSGLPKARSFISVGPLAQVSGESRQQIYVNGVPYAYATPLDARPGHPAESFIRLNDGGTVIGQTATADIVDRIRAWRRTVGLSNKPSQPPVNQTEARQKIAFAKWEDLRQEAQRKAGADSQYGLTDAHEFMAELHTNPAFQAFLAKKSLWTRAVDGVRNLLGLPPSSQSMLERAMSLQGEFFGKEQYDAAQIEKRQTMVDNQKFENSPRGAADVIDRKLSAVAAAADDEKHWLGINWARAPNATFDLLKSTQTAKFIASQLRNIPGLEKFQPYAEAFTHAGDIETQAGNLGKHMLDEFGLAIGKQYKGLSQAQTSALMEHTAGIASASSLSGFDYRMNYAEHVAAGNKPPAIMQAKIDANNASFKQLERNYPLAAKNMETAMLGLRAGSIATKATTYRNLLDQKTANAERAASDLAAMPATDSNYAAAMAAVGTAQKEAAIAKDFSPLLDAMGKGIGRKIDNAPIPNGDPMNHLDGTSYTLDQNINKMFEAVKTLPPDSLMRAEFGALEPLYQKNVANPYFHMGRDGDYFYAAKFKDMDRPTWDKLNEITKGSGRSLGDFEGQDQIFIRVDSQDKAAGLRRKFADTLGHKLVDGSEAHGALADNISRGADISTALRSVLANLNDITAQVPGMDAEGATVLRDALTRDIMSSLPESSAKFGTLTQKGIPGFSSDMMYMAARRMGQQNSELAHIYAAPAYADAFKGMRDATVELARAPEQALAQNRAQSVLDEYRLRYQNLMHSDSSQWINQTNSLSHAMYIGGAPAFYIRTYAQPVHRGVPILAGTYGFAPSFMQMIKSQVLATKVVGDAIKHAYSEGGIKNLPNAEFNFDGYGMSPTAVQAMHDLLDSGMLHLGQAQALTSMAEAAPGGKNLKDIVRLASMTAGWAEMTNRFATGHAAYMLAEAGKGGVPNLNHDANVAYAKDVIVRAMDDFDKHNSDRLTGAHGAAGKWTPLATQFMRYPMQTMQQIVRSVQDGYFNGDKSPEGLARASASKKEFAYLMGTTAMISGVMGMPFANAIAGVYNTLASDNDDPTDIRQGVRNFLDHTFGDTGGEIVAHGPLSALGFSTNSFGLQDILPGSSFLASRRLMKDRLADQSNALMGPAINGGMDLAQGFSKLANGQYIKGVEQLLPVALKGFWKAGEMATRGYTDAKGDPMAIKPTATDIGWQALGLTPQDKAEQSEKNSYWQSREERLNFRKQTINDNFYKGVAFQNQAEQQSAIADMAAYNQKNPTEPILNLGDMVRQKMTGLALAGASGTGVAVQKNKFPALMNNIQFGQSMGMQPRQ